MILNPNKYIGIILGILLFNGCKNESFAPIEWREVAVSSIGENQGLAGALIGMSGSRLLIGGGANFPDGLPWEGGKKTYHSKMFVFSFDGQLEWLKEETLDSPRAYAANSPYQKGFVSAGGEDGQNILSRVDYFYLEKDSLIRTSLPDLPLPLTNGSLVTREEALYFVGGENKEGVSDKIYRWKAGDKEWMEYTQLAKPVTHAIVLQDKEFLYLLGGRRKRNGDTSEIYSDYYQIDLNTKEQKRMPDLPLPLAAGTGAVGPDGKLWIFGGDDGSTFTPTEEFLLKIEAENNPSEKESLIKQKNELQKNHPGFYPGVLSLEKEGWMEQMKLPYATPVTTSAVRFQDFILIPNGEIRAGVRSPKILIGKWQNK